MKRTNLTNIPTRLDPGNVFAEETGTLCAEQRLVEPFRLAPEEFLEGTDRDDLVDRLSLFGRLDLANRTSSFDRCGEGDRD